MLRSNKYVFDKFDDHVKNKFIIYGDNLEESIQVIRWLYDFNKDKMKLISIEYNSLSEFIYIFEINNRKYYFIAQAYYRNGRLPLGVRQVIKELDKPDAVVYSVDDDKVLMGFEVTSTTMAGNATWQRTGRVINFLDKEIPFGFLAYYSKNDKSDTNVNKKPRVPSKLFVLLFNILSLKYSTPALVGFFEHPDPNQNMSRTKLNDDWRETIFKYLLCLISKVDGDDVLRECYVHMKQYYLSEENRDSSYEEFGRDNLVYLAEENFEYNILEDMKNKRNVPFFTKESIIFEWKPKKLGTYIRNTFQDIKFFQLSKYCKAGITFQTKDLINILEKGKKVYVADYIKDINQPTVILPIKLTKKDSRTGSVIPTDDPYNGEITAFSNLYLQSFSKANIMLLLTDHTNKNEYNVEDAKTRKIYKAINKYADLVVDLDLNLFSRDCEEATIENRARYEDEFVTEDDVTSFFGTILSREGIEPSFLNPPCGSWSDIRLYPTDKYYYYKRNDQRGDIAFYNENDSTYYIGESKKDFNTFKATINDEYEKTILLKNIIDSEIKKQNLNITINYKIFALFKGTREDAQYIFENSKFDIVVIVNEQNEKVTMEVIERE